MSQFLGTLIRKERLRRNYSQEGLCQGVCAVSYLSKIEQGKAEAGNDILQPLLKRLGITYETDPEFLVWAAEVVAGLYEDLYSGRGRIRAPEDTAGLLQDQRERLLASPYMLDILLLENAFSRGAPPPELRDFIPCMNQQQYEVYLLLQSEDGCETAADELLRLNPCGFYTCQVGISRYRVGRYLEAMELLSRAYDLAAQDGYVYLMCTAKIFLGNCCSDGGQLELMLEHFKVVRRLAGVLQDVEDWLADINYNVGSTFLEWDRAEEALAMLEGVKWKGALYFHKLAIALEKLGRREEALEALKQARTAEIHGPAKAVIGEMLDLVEYRLLHPNYLRDGIYSSMMSSTFHRLRSIMPSGFIRFHLPYMLEVLEAERRYKEAYHLASEFSNVSKLNVS